MPKQSFVRGVGMALALAASGCACSDEDVAKEAGRDLAGQQQRLRQLAPRASGQDRLRDEPRMECLLRAVKPQDLSQFKFGLEYDGDYKDMVEYLFHDIDSTRRQMTIVDHFRSAGQKVGVKVLTDVDDTMYGNLLDRRYPQDKKTPYPGVLAFYNALKSEPAAIDATLARTGGVRDVPVTTLSARPNPIAGALEEQSLQSLVELTRPAGPGDGGLQLKPSALSGELPSAVWGTIQSWFRDKTQRTLEDKQLPLDLLHDRLRDGQLPHGQEDEIGEVKFTNFLKFGLAWPEYRFVFVGDSGQADALTARRMIESRDVAGGPDVVTTFIHLVRSQDGTREVASQSFSTLSELKVREDSKDGRGVIVFGTYIRAAAIAYAHRGTLDNLITAEELATITEAALTQFASQEPRISDEAQPPLCREYREDAELAVRLLEGDPSGAAARVRSALQRPFCSARAAR